MISVILSYLINNVYIKDYNTLVSGAFIIYYNYRRLKRPDRYFGVYKPPACTFKTHLPISYKMTKFI